MSTKREFDAWCESSGRCEREYNEADELAEQERETLELEGE